jgi:UDP-N-acetylglucosamine 1-carboxyvinyltransferase
MLARFKRVLVPEPGGCSIGNRPIDAHLRGLEQLGGQCETQEDGSVEMETKALKGSYVILPEFSVTATENMIMAACLAKGHTSIRLAAAEPHVQELCRFLVACGARIEGIGTHSLEIEGERDLTAPAKAWDIMSDTTEAMTFGVAAALTRGDIMMTRVDPSHLDAIRSLCTRIGIRHEIGEDSFRVIGGGHWEAFKLQALIYPGFPTDMQPLFGLVATQCQGASMIQDPLFESRLGYVAELSKMGANAMILDPHRAVIHGPTPLRGTEIRSLDLRAGATLLIAGMIASGETIIHDAEVIDRGYENIDTRLAALGALIQREAV